MDFYQSIHFFLHLFSLSITFLFLSIFQALLEHDKSKRDVMTQDPLLALGGGRTRERGRGGEIR